jgi:hypothetical protein
LDPTAAEHAWAEALAREHAHQRELLAALRGELGVFAKECAATLTALDSFVDGLGGIVGAIELGKETHERATLALDLARKFPRVVSTTVDEHQVYRELAGDADLSPPAVAHARLSLEQRGRSDAELLRSIVDADGVRAALERAIGPTPLAVAAAIQPLLRLVPTLSTVEMPERDTATSLLDALEEAGASSGVEGIAEARALGDALRDAAAHAESAAAAVEEGSLAVVIAEARVQLHEDLAALAAALEAAPPSPWRAERELELEELREEVRKKLEAVERTRRVLLALLPRVRIVARALALAEKVQADDGAIDTVTPAIARLGLALELGALRPIVTVRRESRGTTRRARKIALAAAAATLVLAAGALAIASFGTESEPVAATAGTTGPTAPVVAPVEAVFSEAERATFYSVAARTSESAEYEWSLEPPADDPTCRAFETVAGKPNEAVWRHADSDGCLHVGTEHLGTVTVTISTPSWTCTASFVGTETRTGPAAGRCRPS